jgi:hypothetical protein
MIRHRHGSDNFLITQDDHAGLSGRLAEHFGNERFAAPLPRKQVIDAISMHDCGWPLHDDTPTLNPAGSPLHVFESPISISTRVWSESTRRAAEIDPYTGLLVSLHVLALSATVHKHDTTPAERDEHRQELFLLNQFHQDQIELQDGLRRQLGLRTDIPLRLGLAKADGGFRDERENLLAFNYKLLRLMDRLSLELCCSEELPWKIDDLPPRPGAEPIDIRVIRLGQGQIAIDPWPFLAGRLEFGVPFRRVPATPFSDAEMFRQVYKRTPTEEFTVRVHRRE